jgi:hypothetical protein
MIPSDIIWHVAEILQLGDQFWIHQLWDVPGILHLGNMKEMDTPSKTVIKIL